MTSYCVYEYIDIDFNMPTSKHVKKELSVLSCVSFLNYCKEVREGWGWRD